MTYTITGLDPARFADRDALHAAGAIRVVADRADAFPCRVTLADAAPGEALYLLNFVSADVDTPFRAAHAIFVRADAVEAARVSDALPPAFDRRTLSLRGFDAAGMLRAAALATPGAGDGVLRGLLDDAEIDHVDIHAAAWGCFLGRADRDGCDAR